MGACSLQSFPSFLSTLARFTCCFAIRLETYTTATWRERQEKDGNV